MAERRGCQRAICRFSQKLVTLSSRYLVAASSLVQLILLNINFAAQPENPTLELITMSCKIECSAGGLSVDEDGDRIFISDSNHHRIIISNGDGVILDCVSMS